MWCIAGPEQPQSRTIGIILLHLRQVSPRSLTASSDLVRSFRTDIGNVMECICLSFVFVLTDTPRIFDRMPHQYKIGSEGGKILAGRMIWSALLGRRRPTQDLL